MRIVVYNNNKSLLPLEFKIAVVIVCLFLVFQRSMAYIGFPPLYGGEITILLFIFLFLRWKSFHSFTQNSIGFVCILYLLIAIPYILNALNDTGIGCMRYAAPVYYSIFIFLGYTVINDRYKQKYFIQIMYYAIVLSISHTLLTKIFSLYSISPLVNGVPLLGNLDQVAIYNDMALPYLIIFWPNLSRKKASILGILGFTGYIFFSGRGSQLALIGSLLAIYYNKNVISNSLRKYFLPMGISFLFLILFFATISQNNKFSQRILLQKDLFIAVFSDSPNLPGKAGSKRHRLEMWKEITSETIAEDPLFGQGFRDKLVDVEFYNPHNSFVNFFGRIGILGLSLVIYIYFGILIKMLKRLRRTIDREYQKYILFYICFMIIIIIVSLTAPTFESPYSALVCNFIFGGALKLYCLSENN